MSGHEVPGCFPESVCAACQREYARLRAIEAAARDLVDRVSILGPIRQRANNTESLFCMYCERTFAAIEPERHSNDCPWQALVRAVGGEGGA